MEIRAEESSSENEIKILFDQKYAIEIENWKELFLFQKTFIINFVS